MNQPQAKIDVAPDDARAIAKEAYVYAFAMMENYNTWYPQAVVKDSPSYVGGFNKFRHYAQLFSPANHDVVTPNNDTPYSWVWLDLRAEPIVVSVPAVPSDRYYVLQFIDLFTYNCAYIGSRSTGNDAGDYLIVGPQWQGDVPGGIKKVFKSETEIVGILGRTQLNGPQDIDNVKQVQAGFKLRPLSAFQKKPAPPAAPVLSFPPYDKAKVASHDFISYLNFLLGLALPPHPNEVVLRQRMEKIGIVAGAAWNASQVEPAVLAAIDAGVKDAQEEIEKKIAVTHGSNGLFGSREAQGEDYLTRAVAAAMGLYGNDLAEAWYGGFVGNGRELIQVTFSKDQLPPAKFFWSITLYTLPDRFLYDNPLNRYSIGDRTQGLKYNADGGLTIYVGHASPGTDKESNWIPAPDASYSFVARVYGPSEAAMNGTWKLPSPAAVS
ncbi:DUF1254 domain-containing protein [Glaciimonas soli]|uniref:DUF1254 domain-containing protein n=1 Tax=Glaciimonas soli TaxID=2590999 RepID=A0A843YNE9_9BURK|nr:DUF1254 domain-containing protein [Glaciimonas soli]MQR00995.1 DUF1254 domain-containing protein [Glaciimonas soli]